MFTSRLFLNISAVAALTLGAASLSSCDGNGIYEDLTPCSTDHKVSFYWNYNMLGADAFKENVHSMTIYGFNKETGILEFMLTERGDKLAQDGFAIDLDDVPEGDYDIVAWGGLDNSARTDTTSNTENFLIHDAVIGETTRDDIYVKLEREVRADGSNHSENQLFDLFHGLNGEVKIYAPNETPGETHHYQVPLKKNTNRINIILQQLSGEDMDASQFSYTVVDNNGTMNADNEVNGEAPQITYHPFLTMEGVAGMGIDGYPDARTRAYTMAPKIPQFWLPGEEIPSYFKTRAGSDSQFKPIKVAVAGISISRLVTDHSTALNVYNPDKELVCTIPLQDYARILGTLHGGMGEQEYLDREDTYNLTFFLDKNNQWVNTAIIINSWKLLVKNGEFGN